MKSRTLASLSLIAIVLGILPGGASAASDPNDPFFSLQWGLSKIGAPAAWEIGSGAGVVIAVIDSGVDLNHEDLASKIVAGHDFIDGDESPQDENGHGTHVSGIAAAITGNGQGVAGTAPEAKIMPLRVLDGNGACSPCATSQAIRYAVDHGAKVINLSLAEVGQEVFGPGQSFTDALDYAWSHGVIAVIAAGNSYFLTSGYSNNNAIIVSATNRSDGRPDFSNGVGSAKWGIAAPGGGSTFDSSSGDIYSTYWDGSDPNRYAYNAGTSMSAPHVAGAAAVLRGLGLSAQQTVDRLLSTATDLGTPGRDSTFGAGRLDLAAAVKGLGSTGSGGGGGAGGGPSPTPRRRSGGGSGTGSTTPVASQTPPLDPTGPGPTTSPTVAVPDDRSGPPSPRASNQGWIAGGIAGGLFAIAGLVQWLRKRSRA